MMGTVKAFVLFLLSLQACWADSDADPDHRCSHCLATAEVLASRISTEKTRNHLDFRGRLDGDGTRYGKILDFRLSELRIIELLENLSSDLEWFKQVEVEGVIRWQHQDRVTGNVTDAPDLEKQHWKRQLKRWCEQNVEVHEESIAKYLQSDSISKGGIQDLLCERLTKVCKGHSLGKEEL